MLWHCFWINNKYLFRRVKWNTTTMTATRQVVIVFPTKFPPSRRSDDNGDGRFFPFFLLPLWSTIVGPTMNRKLRNSVGMFYSVEYEIFMKSPWNWNGRWRKKYTIFLSLRVVLFFLPCKAQKGRKMFSLFWRVAQPTINDENINK